jgi:hypothetical protein
MRKAKKIIYDRLNSNTTKIFNDKGEKLYLVSIIDHFSKYSYNYIKKDENTILNKMKDFIHKNGITDKILTYKGKEFKNTIFKKYYDRNGKKLIHGKARHLQERDDVERYNRITKDLLKIYI